MKKFLFLFIAGIFNAFCGFAEEGIPELVFDKNDPELAIGIKLNLPTHVQEVIMSDYLKNDKTLDGFTLSKQEDFTKQLNLMQDVENYKALIKLVLQGKDFFIPVNVLQKGFLKKFRGIYWNGRIGCYDSAGEYFALLENFIADCIEMSVPIED